MKPFVVVTTSDALAAEVIEQKAAQGYELTHVSATGGNGFMATIKVVLFFRLLPVEAKPVAVPRVGKKAA